MPRLPQSLEDLLMFQSPTKTFYGLIFPLAGGIFEFLLQLAA
jgi:hypothetical protein